MGIMPVIYLETCFQLFCHHYEKSRLQSFWEKLSSKVTVKFFEKNTKHPELITKQQYYASFVDRVVSLEVEVDGDRCVGNPRDALE